MKNWTTLDEFVTRKWNYIKLLLGRKYFLHKDIHKNIKDWEDDDEENAADKWFAQDEKINAKIVCWHTKEVI